jgi:DNA-binding MarR family transcriptional regulator
VERVQHHAIRTFRCITQPDLHAGIVVESHIFPSSIFQIVNFSLTFELFEYRNVCSFVTMTVKKENINRLINAIFNLMHGMKKGVEDCCVRCGNLNEKEFLIINFVGQKHNVKMSDLSESLSAPLSTLTSIVDKLVERNYLSRYHSSEDRRVVLVSLASHGKETYDAFMTQKQEMAMKILSHFETEDQENLIHYLEEIPLIVNGKK